MAIMSFDREKALFLKAKLAEVDERFILQIKEDPASGNFGESLEILKFCAQNCSDEKWLEATEHGKLPEIPLERPQKYFLLGGFLMEKQDTQNAQWFQVAAKYFGPRLMGALYGAMTTKAPEVKTLETKKSVTKGLISGESMFAQLSGVLWKQKQ